MKVLLVASDLSDGGGVNRVIANLSHILAGFPELELHVLHAREFRGCTYDMPTRVKIIQARRYVKRFNALNILANQLQLRSCRYDYVLSFWTHENIVTSLAFLGSRTKLILSEHFCYDQAGALTRTMRSWLYRMAHKVLVLNSEEFQYYRRFCSNVELLPNPVVGLHGEPLPHGTKENLVIGVGHLIKRKGFSYFVDACIKARIADAGWQAVIIGDGPERAGLQELIDRSGAAAYIRISPSTRNIDNWYKRAKVILVPSLSEVFSMVIPEAMAHGVVPIAFAVDGPKEIMRDHRENLVPPLDTEALAAALRCIMNDPDLCKRGSAMREEAFLRYSLAALRGEWRRLLSL